MLWFVAKLHDSNGRVAIERNCTFLVGHYTNWAGGLMWNKTSERERKKKKRERWCVCVVVISPALNGCSLPRFTWITKYRCDWEAEVRLLKFRKIQILECNYATSSSNSWGLKRGGPELLGGIQDHGSQCMIMLYSFIFWFCFFTDTNALKHSKSVITFVYYFFYCKKTSIMNKSH